jgi:hypothetical protein
MDIRDIKDNFDKFNIPEKNIPQYENPHQFGSEYERCEILEYNNTSYSNSSNYKNNS